MCRAGSEGPTRQRRVSPTTGWCRESLRRTSLALVRPGMGEAGIPRSVTLSFSWAGVNKIKSHGSSTNIDPCSDSGISVDL